MNKESTKSVEMIEVSTLVPYSNNARTHSDEQIMRICRSIEEFGFVNPVLIDKNKRIIAGHGRTEAAKRIGLEKVPCLRVDGLTENQIRAYILADNRLAEDAGWDDEILRQELQELKDNGFEISLTGFSIDDLSVEEIDFSEIDESVEIAEEKAVDKPMAKKGKRYKLGRHFLMCGDSTNPDDVKELMHGVKADLVITDPPYNVGLGYDMDIKEAKRRKRRLDGLVIENDKFQNEADFIEFLKHAFNNISFALKPGGAFYIWAPSMHLDSFFEALRETDLEAKELLIWVKNIFALGRQDYQWRHEPCIYGWKEGAAHYFINNRKKTTVLEQKIDVDGMTEEEAKNLLKKFFNESEVLTTALHEDKPTRSELHPTMKPVRLFERQIENSSKENEVVLDLFGGSGTALISCENKNRVCYIMEFDEHYADVIIHRWEELTGEKAELL